MPLFAKGEFGILLHFMKFQEGNTWQFFTAMRHAHVFFGFFFLDPSSEKGLNNLGFGESHMFSLL